MSDLIDFSGSTQQMSAVVTGTTADQLTSPTPIGLTVAQLLGHVHDLAVAFCDAAAKGETAIASSAPDPAALDAAEGFAASIPNDPEARQGLLGPRVALPEGAPQLDRVLGLAGRDPGWRPAP